MDEINDGIARAMPRERRSLRRREWATQTSIGSRVLSANPSMSTVGRELPLRKEAGNRLTQNRKRIQRQASKATAKLVRAVGAANASASPVVAQQVSMTFPRLATTLPR